MHQYAAGVWSGESPLTARMPPGSRCAPSAWNQLRVNRPQSASVPGAVRSEKIAWNEPAFADRLPDVGDFHDDPVIGEARPVPGGELGTRKGEDIRVVVDYADRRDSLMPKQLADEQAVAAAEHEQVKRPLEPRPRSEQGGMGEPLVVNRLVGGVELKDHRKDPGFARPITLATTGSSRVGVLCEYFARFSFSRLGGGGLEDRGGHEIGRLGPRAPGSQFTRRSCDVRRDATRTGRPAKAPCERSFASFTGAVNRYNDHDVYIDVPNEVSVMPARGAQSC